MKLLPMRLPLFASVLSLAVLPGCSILPGGSPSHQNSQIQGGFTVRVDGPGLPTAKNAVADIETYAQGRGFVRQPAKATPGVDPVTHEPLPPAPDRYLMGTVVLEVSRQPAEHRVTAYLYGASPKGDRQFTNRFYRGFDQAFAPRYGGNDPVSESAYAADTGGLRGAGGTLGSGAAPASNSPLESGVPPVSGASSGSGAPAGRQ